MRGHLEIKDTTILKFTGDGMQFVM